MSRHISKAEAALEWKKLSLQEQQKLLHLGAILRKKEKEEYEQAMRHAISAHHDFEANSYDEYENFYENNRNTYNRNPPYQYYRRPRY